MAAETAIIYCRQSYTTDKDKLSISDQQRKAYEYAKQHKIELLTTPFIDENTSSELYPDTDDAHVIAPKDKSFMEWYSSSERHAALRAKKRIAYKQALGQCFNFIAEHKVNYLIVWSFERLGRAEASSMLQPFLTDFLKSNFVKLVETKDGHITDYNNSNDQLMALIKSHIELESLKTKKRSSMNVIKRRIDNRISISNAYGVNRVKNEIQFDKNKTAVIKYIFESINSGKTYAEILNILNTKFITYRTKKAKCFYESSIYNISANPIYAGLMKIEENGAVKFREVSNCKKTIISPALFFAVQENVKNRKNRQGKAKVNSNRKSLPLSGLLYCSCGSKLTVIYDDEKVFYRCHKFDILHNVKCRESRIRMYYDNQTYGGLYDVIQQLLVISFVSDIKATYLIEEFTRKEQNIMMEIENKKADLKTCFEIVKKTHRIDLFREQFLTMENELKELEKNLANLQSKKRIDRKKLAVEIESVFSQIQRGERIDEGLFANLARKTIQKVTVYGDKINIELKDGNSFDLPRIKGKWNAKFLPKGTIKIEKIKGEGDFMIDWRKRFHLVFHVPNGTTKKTLAESDIYAISIVE